MLIDKELGRLLRDERLTRGWQLETIAQLYGVAATGKPVTTGAIYMFEAGKLPQSKTRRWILATIYGIAPLALGLEVPRSTRISSYSSYKPRSVDVVEFRETLYSYWTHGYSGTPEQALVDVASRIRALHDNVLYSSQSTEMKRLLIGYHLRRSEIARELFYNKTALDHLNKAVILARDEDFSDLEAAALYRRGEFFYDTRNYTSALENLKAAQALDVSSVTPSFPIPSHVLGRIINVRGVVEANLAQSQQDMLKATKLIDSASKYITPVIDPDLCTIDLEESRYYVDRAKAMIAPASYKLRIPEEGLESALKILDSGSAHPRFQVYDTVDSYLIQSACYLTQGLYPIACASLHDAVEKMREINTPQLLSYAINLFEMLKRSNYGKSIEVAELGLSLLFLQHPQLQTTTRQ